MTSVAALLFLAISAQHGVQAFVQLQGTERDTVFNPNDALHATAVRRSPGSHLEHELAMTSDSDALTRWAAKIAHKQGVTLVQIHTEPAKPDGKHLGQAQVSLQIRGTYPSLKIVLISLLNKFPGLVLEHLTVRHPSANGVKAVATATSDGIDDEATIELIQYSKAPQAAP